MVVYNSEVDPYTPSKNYYECRACGTRVITEDHRASCPDCTGAVRNIGVARE